MIFQRLLLLPPSFNEALHLLHLFSYSELYNYCAGPRSPQRVKKHSASRALTASSASPIASTSTSRVRAPIILSNRLTFENVPSIGI